VDACSWDNPGANPYTGTVAAAVAQYDLPNDVRAELIRKAARVQFDDVAHITKAGIRSRHTTYTNMRDMHFGRSMCSGPVSVSGWSSDHIEYALIYCSQGHCIAVPFVCRNVSLIQQRSPVTNTYPRDEFPANGKAHRPPWADKVPGKTNNIPEPSTLLLVAAAVAALAFTNRKKT